MRCSQLREEGRFCGILRTVGIDDADGHFVGVLAQTRRAMLDLQHEAEQRATALAQELRKAEQRNKLTRLTAPVDGTVQQLAVHTAGGVVTPAQALLVIVPDNAEVTAEQDRRDPLDHLVDDRVRHHEEQRHQPAPDALQATVGGQHVIQTCDPRRCSAWPGYRSCR